MCGSSLLLKQRPPMAWPFLLQRLDATRALESENALLSAQEAACPFLEGVRQHCTSLQSLDAGPDLYWDHSFFHIDPITNIPIYIHFLSSLRSSLWVCPLFLTMAHLFPTQSGSSNVGAIPLQDLRTAIQNVQGEKCVGCDVPPPPRSLPLHDYVATDNGITGGFATKRARSA